MTEGRPLSRILQLLEERGSRPVGRNGNWRAHCPAHDDRRPSLSLRDAEDGKVLLKCLAGCSTEAVLAALGLEWGDLFPPHERRNGHSRQRPQGQAEADPLGWWAERCGVPKEWLRKLPIEARDGAVAFRWPGLEVAKLRAPGAKGWWMPEDGPRPPLWPPLPHKAPPILVLTEGESDATVAAHCLGARGLKKKAFAVAVTKGAAQRPDPALLRELVARGVRAVLAVGDADEVGQKWAEAWTEAARQAGLMGKALDLVALGLVAPSLGEKDLRDAYRQRPAKTRAALKEAVQALQNLTSDIIPPFIGSKVLATESRGVSAAELRAAEGEPLSWLPFLGQEGFLWEGSVALLSGYAKVGKTTLVAQLLLEWAETGRKVHVLSEEGLRSWRWRLAELPDGPWDKVTIEPALGLGIEGLCKVLQETTADVLVVDTLRKVAPLPSFRDTGQVNSAFAQLLASHQHAQAVRGRPLTLVLTHHDRKSTEGAEEGQRVADSHVIFGSVDTVLELVRGEGSRRLLRGWGRLVEPPTVLLEMGDDGLLRILGSPQEVALEAVKAKAVAALEEADGWLTTKEVREAMPPPRPSDDLVRRALMELAREGVVERNPPLSEGTRQGVTYRWRLRPSGPGGNFASDEGVYKRK